MPGVDVMALEASIYTNVSGTLSGDAAVDVIASQNISSLVTTLFWVVNGTIRILVREHWKECCSYRSANDISTGDLFDQIVSYGSAVIGGDVLPFLNATSLSVNGTFDTRMTTRPARSTAMPAWYSHLYRFNFNR